MGKLPYFAKEKKKEKKDMDFSTLTDGKALRAIKVRAFVLANLVTVLNPTGSEISGFRKEWVFRKRSAHFAETCRKSHFFERFLNKVGQNC